METTESLRLSLQNYQQQHPGRRYPDELRERVIAYTRQQMGQGKRAWREATELGIGQSTMQRLLSVVTKPELAVARMLAVKVVEPVEAERIVVHGGHGVTVEGLGFADVVELLRALA